jgi:hypothetical protein
MMRAPFAWAEICAPKLFGGCEHVLKEVVGERLVEKPAEPGNRVEALVAFARHGFVQHPENGFVDVKFEDVPIFNLYRHAFLVRHYGRLLIASFFE